MTDRFGVDIKVGDKLLYASTDYSSVILQVGKVKSLSPKSLLLEVIYSDHYMRDIRVFSTSNCVVLDENVHKRG
jgi:hypothetical protein